MSRKSLKLSAAFDSWLSELLVRQSIFCVKSFHLLKLFTRKGWRLMLKRFWWGSQSYDTRWEHYIEIKKTWWGRFNFPSKGIIRKLIFMNLLWGKKGNK